MNGIVAFCGSKGAGKSTSSDIFKNFFHGDIEEVALAGHLKTSCSEVFGVHMDNFLIPELKEVELENYVNLTPKNLEALLAAFNVTEFTYDEHIRPHVGKVLISPRKLLQYIGTEVLHPLDPLIHVKTMMVQKDPNKLTLITDLRFLNEFNYLNDNFSDNFVPFYVKNSTAELAAEDDTHPSEKELLLFRDKCELLSNESSLSELKRRICMTTARLEGRLDETDIRASQKG